MGLKNRLDLPVLLEGIADFPDYTDSHLGRKIELGSEFLIELMVKTYLIRSILFKSFPSEPIASLIDSLHSGKEHFSLFGRRKQFSFNYEYHNLDYTPPKLGGLKSTI